MKKNTLKKMLALVLVLCMIVPMTTVLAATNYYLEVTIEDNRDPQTKLQAESSKYLTDTSYLAETIMGVVTANQDELKKFGSVAMHNVMAYGISAFANESLWQNWITTEFTYGDAATRNLLASRTSTLADLKDTARFQYVNNGATADHYGKITAEPEYVGTVYTVTVTKKVTDFGGETVDPTPSAPSGGSTTTTGPASPAKTGLNKTLQTSTCVAFMQGYTDGSFKPNAQISRKEVAQMFYNLLKSKTGAVDGSFDDVATAEWYATAVNTMADKGIINGDGKGNFMPNRQITRAEFVAIAARLAKAATGTVDFSDVSTSHWAYDEIATAMAYNWLAGYPDGTFRPDAPITRAEAATIVARILARTHTVKQVTNRVSSVKTFTDVTADHWAYASIVEATNAH